MNACILDSIRLTVSYSYNTQINSHMYVDKKVRLVNKVAEEYWGKKLGAVTTCYLNNG